ncbi:glycerophosphodiester phosphodiesterase family protein [soil metagenome]
MIFAKKTLAALLRFFLSLQLPAQHLIKTTSPAQLRKFFQYSPDRIPLISAHRGGATLGYPENCLETFERTLQFTPAMIECDPQLSKDGVLVLMHDCCLDRTTNGFGAIADHTLAELRQLRLKDPQGNLTEFQIPTLEEVLQWAKDKTLLTIDIKPGVTPEMIERLVRKHRAESYATVIAYDLATARQYFQLNPKLIISLTFRSIADVHRLDESGIPFANVIAFTGVSEPEPEVYRTLHQRGISCLIGTMGNLDRQHATGETNVYAQLVRNGADIITTDRPKEAAEALKEINLPKSSKRKFYQVKKLELAAE